MVKTSVVGLFTTRGVLYATVNAAGGTVDRADVVSSTFLVGLYRLAVLVYPTCFSITATATTEF